MYYKKKGGFYNINEVYVKCKYENKYIRFSKELNEYLLKEYPEYYDGLKLYEHKVVGNVFIVMARYKEAYGLEEAIEEIKEDIANIYIEEWGDSVVRTSIFTFSDYNRIL